jgi:hypothetical protein
VAIPNWQFFRVIDLTPVTNDDDWPGTASSSTRATVSSHIITVPLDNRTRGPCEKISIYAQILTAAGALVDRGTMTFDITPVEIARPGDPGSPGVEGAEPESLIGGTTVASAPCDKKIVEIGPGARQIAFRISNIQNVPGTADTMRVYWRPGA